MNHKTIYMLLGGIVIGGLLGLSASILAASLQGSIPANYMPDPNINSLGEVVKPDNASSTVLMTDPNISNPEGLGLKFDNYVDDWRMKNASTTGSFVTTSQEATSTILNKGITAGTLNASGTAATSTFANGIQVPSTHCYFVAESGCAVTEMLPMGYPASGMKMVRASTTNLANNVIQDIYTVPAGKRTMITGFTSKILDVTAGSCGAALYLKTGGNYYQFTSTTSHSGAAAIASEDQANLILENGDALSVLMNSSSCTGGSNAAAWAGMIEFSERTPVFSKRVIAPAVNSTTTLYTVPTGKTARLLSDWSVHPTTNDSTLNLVVFGGSATIRNTWHLVGSDSAANRMNAVRENTTSVGKVATAFQAGTLGAGDIVQIVHATAQHPYAIYWINIAEYGVK